MHKISAVCCLQFHCKLIYSKSSQRAQTSAKVNMIWIWTQD